MRINRNGNKVDLSVGTRRLLKHVVLDHRRSRFAPFQCIHLQSNYAAVPYNPARHPYPRTCSIRSSVKAGYEGSNMTVCVAAMCEQAGIVIGAADRMITSGDIEFEP